VPKLAAALQSNGFDKSAIDAFVVATGPGSFTGLRVGLSTIKALAEVLHRPIAPVSLLEALAWAAPPQSRVIVALDAARGQVFVGEFMTDGETLPRTLRESLLTVDEFAAELRSGRPPALYTPDVPVIEGLKARGIVAMLMARPRADAIARLGLIKLAAGQSISPEALEANYIRRSDAEIFAKPGG
jgi:tRNA threonylcarbamoyladenosine biosynthesis protein TsaB